MATELEQAVERLQILKGKLDHGWWTINATVASYDWQDKPTTEYRVIVSSDGETVANIAGSSLRSVVEQVEEVVAMRLLGESHEIAAVESLGAGLEAVQ